MLEKFKKIEDRFKELEQLLADPKNISDKSRYQSLAKEFSELNSIMGIFTVFFYYFTIPFQSDSINYFQLDNIFLGK